MQNVYSLEELEKIIEEEIIVVLYFSNDACNICKVLRPKVAKLIASSYQEVKMIYIDTEKSPVISGQYRVFSIPTIDIYVEGREHARYSRNLMMHEFEASLKKPYQMLFSAE